MTRASDLLRFSDRQHLMLLYNDEQDRNSVEIECLNHALEAGQFCVYATVDAHEKGFTDRLATKITNYRERIRHGDLLIVDFIPFYESAVAGSLDSFNRLKAKVEAILKDRAAEGMSEKVLLVADAACTLTKHGQFEQCVTLERWWQDTYREWMRGNMDITIICAHPAFALHGSAVEKMRISHAHSLTLDLKDAGRPVRVLIAEPEQDMQTVYKWYLGAQAIEVITVGSGQECCERAAKEEFDLIIVDTHLKDIEGREVAGRILQNRSGQKIIFTTTHDKGYLRSRLGDLPGSENHQIMVKPFDFTQLLGMMPKPGAQNSGVRGIVDGP